MLPIQPKFLKGKICFLECVEDQGLHLYILVNAFEHRKKLLEI